MILNLKPLKFHNEPEQLCAAAWRKGPILCRVAKFADRDFFSQEAEYALQDGRRFPRIGVVDKGC